MKQNRKRRRYWNKKRPQVLVVDAAGNPINVFDFEDALTRWSTGSAIILAYYDEDIRIRSGRNLEGERTVDMACPSVIMMKDCIPSDFNMINVDILQPTKQNLYEREKGRCCYCGRKIKYSEATRDHVYPESLGGLSDWMNLRICCQPCNSLKDNKTITELGWKFPRRLGIPTLTKEAPKNIIHHIGGRIPHESWRPYIRWQVKMKEKNRDIEYPVKWKE